MKQYYKKKNPNKMKNKRQSPQNDHTIRQTSIKGFGHNFNMICAHDKRILHKYEIYESVTMVCLEII